MRLAEAVVQNNAATACCAGHDLSGKLAALQYLPVGSPAFWPSELELERAI